MNRIATSRRVEAARGAEGGARGVEEGVDVARALDEDEDGVDDVDDEDGLDAEERG